MTCKWNIPVKNITYYPQEVVGAVSRTHCTFICKLEERNSRNEVYETGVMFNTSMRIVILSSRLLVTCTSETALKFSCVLCVRVDTCYLMLCCVWLEPGINTVFGLLHAGWSVESDAVTETCCLWITHFLLLQISPEAPNPRCQRQSCSRKSRTVHYHVIRLCLVCLQFKAMGPNCCFFQTMPIALSLCTSPLNHKFLQHL
jgi:hypothetical protein